MANSSGITIGIKTFLRDQHLFRCLEGIQKNFSDCAIIVADDGRPSFEKTCVYNNIRCSWDSMFFTYLDFDSGFGVKSNIIAQNFKTPYLLIGSDDFDFGEPGVRHGIEKLVDVLNNTDVDIASGRVNGNPYEFDLEDQGDVVIEHSIWNNSENRIGEPVPWFYDCDLSVNFSLIKKRVFEKVKWDDDVKIGGGEHGSMHLDCKRAGFKMAYVPGVNINEIKLPVSQEYREYRNRARNPERPCFVKRNVRKYILGNGQVDYDETNIIRS